MERKALRFRALCRFDSFSLIDNLNAIKRTQLLTDYNTGDEDVQYLRKGQHGSGMS